MFSTERSDFGSTIAGYLFAAILLILGGLQFLNLQFELFDTTNPVPFRILAILLVVSGAIALWKAYIIDGVTFMIVALSGSGFTFGQLGYTAADMFVHFNHLFIEKLKLFLSYGLNINYLITIRNGMNAITEKK